MRRIHRGGPTPDEQLEIQIEETRHRRFLKAMALKSEIGLSDDERHSLAQMIPGVDKDDGGSWKELNPKQLSILINMLEGYLLISELLQQRVQRVVATTSLSIAPKMRVAGSTYSAGSNIHTHTFNMPAGTVAHRLMMYTGSEWVPLL
jgi:hypothetical protein